MTIQLYAQPYDLAATGFCFTSFEDYLEKSATLRNSYGQPVEEFEIQFIDGSEIDCDLAHAIGLNQANLKAACAAFADWDEDDKTRVTIAVGECGYAFDATTQPGDFEVDIYPFSTLRDLAEHFVEDGLFGDIPERLQFYIDYDAIAHDLSCDYAEANIGGTPLIYRCA